LAPTLILAYATVGAVVASLRPKNGVGWLCLALGIFPVLTNGIYLLADLVHQVFLANWLSSLDWVPVIVAVLAVTMMLLIFPDGRLLSRRWRFAVWTAAVGAGLVAIADSLPGFYSGLKRSRWSGS
jgi:hypothetical protein